MPWVVISLGAPGSREWNSIVVMVVSRLPPRSLLMWSTLIPMFPAHGKTALPGKRMQVTRALPGAETDMSTDELLCWIEAGRTAARRRVVLKRRLKDPVVGSPDWQIKGRSVRFDVYRGTGSPGLSQG